MGVSVIPVVIDVMPSLNRPQHEKDESLYRQQIPASFPHTCTCRLFPIALDMIILDIYFWNDCVYRRTIAAAFAVEIL